MSAVAEKTVVVWVAGTRVYLSRHAVERYHERVRPALSPERVREEMREVLRQGERLLTPPEWLLEASSLARELAADWWLVLGDSIVLPIAQGRAVTCLTRSDFGELYRERRSAQRASQPRRDEPRKGNPKGRMKAREAARAQRRREKAMDYE